MKNEMTVQMDGANPGKAVRRLVLATAGWGLSFPIGKALMQILASSLPDRPAWRLAALVLLARMLIATVVLAALLGRRLRSFTSRELRQGCELGLFGGLGMLLQTDAQNFIPASTSAFFTQFTCIFVPIAVTFRERRAPPAIVLAACVLVMTGCLVLSDASTGQWRLGRGEWETIASAVLFTGQILCLERPVFQPNDAFRSAAAMFATKGALLFLFLLCAGEAQSVALPFRGGLPSILTLVLALVCTVFSYGSMNRWQPEVTATQAGVIYATEPVFASLWAMFLPGWISAVSGIVYANERFTWRLAAGGGLVLAANLLLIRLPGKPAHGDPAPIS